MVCRPCPGTACRVWPHLARCRGPEDLAESSGLHGAGAVDDQLESLSSPVSSSASSAFAWPRSRSRWCCPPSKSASSMLVMWDMVPSRIRIVIPPVVNVYTNLYIVDNLVEKMAKLWITYVFNKICIHLCIQKFSIN